VLVQRLLAASIAATLGTTAVTALAEPSSYDKEFLAHAADAGSTEIAASKLAATHASDPAIKSFAKEMVSDHTKVAAELKKLAKSKGVKLSDKPGKDNAEEVAKLRGLKGEEFDKEYANKIGVDAHKDTVEKFTNATRKATDPDVKDFAVRTLPRLQEHVAMAVKLHGNMGQK
jgi:putative membrane protein